MIMSDLRRLIHVMTPGFRLRCNLYKLVSAGYEGKVTVSPPETAEATNHFEESCAPNHRWMIVADSALEQMIVAHSALELGAR